MSILFLQHLQEYLIGTPLHEQKRRAARLDGVELFDGLDRIGDRDTVDTQHDISRLHATLLGRASVFHVDHHGSLGIAWQPELAPDLSGQVLQRHAEALARVLGSRLCGTACLGVEVELPNRDL